MDYYSILVNAYRGIDIEELKARFGDECSFDMRGTSPGVVRIIVKDIKINPYNNYSIDERNEDSLLLEIRAKIEIMGSDVISIQGMKGIP